MCGVHEEVESRFDLQFEFESGGFRALFEAVLLIRRVADLAVIT